MAAIVVLQGMHAQSLRTESSYLLRPLLELPREALSVAAGTFSL